MSGALAIAGPHALTVFVGLSHFEGPVIAWRGFSSRHFVVDSW